MLRNVCPNSKHHLPMRRARSVRLLLAMGLVSLLLAFNALRRYQAMVAQVKFKPVENTILECQRFVTPVRSAGKLVDISGNNSRVAVCLFGEARHFELTGLSIRTYVLDVLPFAHVFLNSPLDRDSHKLSILAGARAKSHFAKARIFRPDRLPETKILQEVVGTEGASHGLQGLLQYFSLIETCGDMILEYEQKHKFQFEWIVMSRLDSYWTSAIPTSYERGVHSIPHGNNYGGVNEKLGVSDRGTAMAAGLRLSILPSLHAQGHRSLWAEALFESQLELHRTMAAPRDFSFCLVDHKVWPWPPDGWHLPVVSLSSKGPLNGAYCRPCNPRVRSTEQAVTIVESLCKRSGWFPTNKLQNLELCDASHLNWDEGWEAKFDSAAGSEAAAVRMNTGRKSMQRCLADQAAFQAQWEMWAGPSPREVCRVESGNPWPKTLATSF